MLIQILIAAFVVYTIATIIRLIHDNRMPQATWAWILTCLMFPGVGLAAYFFTGRSRKAFSKHRQLTHQTVGENLTERLRHLVEQKQDNIEKIRLGRTQSYKKRLLHLLYENSSSVLTTNNQVEILQDASEKYPRLIQDIRNAQQSIHLQYYIWSSDDFTEKIKALLIEKVRQGVEVRILYDYLGSFGSLKRRYVRELREGGVQIYPYLYTSRIHNIGYRNHRKIAIIDGCISYVGGMNMGQEHLDGGKHFSSWRDTHLRLVGEAALLLQGMFLVEWYNTLGEKLTHERYLPPLHETYGDAPVQIVPSGPDSEWATIRQLYFFMILAAEKRVYIQSPFFILNESIAEAIRAAALSGVDVKIMLAPRGGVYDMPYAAARTYCADMARAGAKIYFYQKGYFHPKSISIDSALCSVGSANMDIRSFSINYEVNAVLYDERLACELEQDFERDLQHCIEFKLEDYMSSSSVKRFRDSVYRLFSPLL